MRLEGKPRRARLSPNPKVQAKQDGVTLGQTMTAIWHLDRPGENEPEQQTLLIHRWRDQESWLLCLQGIRFCIVKAFFTARYMASVSGHVIWSERNVVFRSGSIELDQGWLCHGIACRNGCAGTPAIRQIWQLPYRETLQAFQGMRRSEEASVGVDQIVRIQEL